jgi:hypothetical protein
MSAGGNKPAKKRLKAEEAVVRGVLHRWQPIPGAPEDEYDCLVHHLLSVLHSTSKPNSEKLAACISKEMIEHFGISVSSDEASAISGQISEALEASNV